MGLKRPIIFAILLLTFTKLSFAKTITNIRYWTAPDHTRIVFDVDSIPKYSISPYSGERCLIIELEQAVSALDSAKYIINNDLIETVRIKAKDENTLGIILNLKSSAKAEIFTLKKYLDKPERLVIDLVKPELEEAIEREIKKIDKERQLGGHIVVIDPGHGGEDPGAIGCCMKLEEKEVVLNVSLKLRDCLKRAGITTYLTREGDYYLPLGKRPRLAEKYKADLMISIHANSSKSGRGLGFSLYYLSPKGASDKASELLAKKENEADLIGGASLSDNKTLNAILIDMLQTSTVNESVKLGETTLKNIEGINKIEVDEKLHSAAFAVLKSPSVPSILAELAFLSNREEEKLLADPDFQQEMAQRLSNSIQDYLEISHDVPIQTADQEKEGKKIQHVVAKGETIWAIAHKYGINPDKLRSANGMGRSNYIKVGQSLFIPR